MPFSLKTQVSFPASDKRTDSSPEVAPKVAGPTAVALSHVILLEQTLGIHKEMLRTS